MIIKKKYILLLLSLIFIFASCNAPEERSLIGLNMSLSSLSTDESFDGEKFKIIVKSETGVELDASKCLDFIDNIPGEKENEVKFDLKGGTYTFEFLGYATSCDNANATWKGSSLVEIDSSNMNYITIPIGKVGEFVLASEVLHATGAFMDAVLIKNKIILSGGASFIEKNFNKLSATPCTCSSNPKCVCKVEEDTGFIPIDTTRCEAQGMLKNDCDKCLKVESNRFEDFSRECDFIQYCTLDATEGNNCNLRVTDRIQYLNTNSLFSALEGEVNSENDNEFDDVILTSKRIFHKSHFLSNSNKLYFIGGASEASLTNTAPYITVGGNSNINRNMIDIYDLNLSNVKGLTSAILIPKEDPRINLDFNILFNDNNFSVFGGRTRNIVGVNNFYKSIVTCDVSGCKEDNLSADNIFSTSSGFITVDKTSYIFGGISLNNDDQDLTGTDLYSFIDDAMDTPNVVSDIENKNIYQPKLFNYNAKIYAVGGLFFTNKSSEIEFDKVVDNKTYTSNNNVLIYDTSSFSSAPVSRNIPEVINNVIFSTITEYAYGDNDDDGVKDKGLLFVGGLKKDGANKFRAIKDVIFISFDDLNSDISCTYGTNGTDCFRRLGSGLNKARFAHSVVVDNDKLWVLGGLSAKEDQASTDYFITNQSIEIFIP